MPANREDPQIVVEGIEDIIKRDLDEAKAVVVSAELELASFRQARSHVIKRKKHYRTLIGGGKYDDESLRTAMDGMAIDIRHLSDKEKLHREKIAHYTGIIDTLTDQLANQHIGLRALERQRRKARRNAADN